MPYAFIPYQPRHARKILECNVREQDMWLLQHPDRDNLLRGWNIGAASFTFKHDREIVFCGGILFMGWQRGTAWLLPSMTFYRHVKASYRAMRDKIGEIQHTHALRRIQAVVDADFDAARRYAEHLGFKCEGLLECYGLQGEDMLMYGRVWRE
jgi:RimJ/RimL family protein N-acetyltransferase